MSWARRFTRASLIRTKGGPSLYYPYALLGSGYVIPDEEAFAKLERFSERWIVLSFVLSVVWFPVFNASRLLGSISLLAGTAVLLLWHWRWNRRTVASWEGAESRLSPVESRLLQAKALGWPVLVFGLLMSLLFVVFGLLVLLSGPDSGVSSWLVIGFFGLLAAGYGALIVLRLRPPDRENEHPGA